MLCFIYLNTYSVFTLQQITRDVFFWRFNFFRGFYFFALLAFINFNLSIFEKSVPIADDRNFLNDTLLNKNISIRWIF